MSKNVFYEEEGSFKVGAVLADNETSLHVEAPYGKRSKVKASAVLIRFDGAGLAQFIEEAGKLAAAMDADFLWQCCGQEEFAFETLAREYFGRAPTPTESAGLLVKLHSAPMYFYKKGRGRYRAAPPEALKAALASVERKQREAERRAQYVAELTAGRLPSEFAPLAAKLLYGPDRRSVEWKALEEACEKLKTTPAKLFERRVNDACAQGARLLVGNKRAGASYSPTVLDNVRPEMELVPSSTAVRKAMASSSLPANRRAVATRSGAPMSTGKTSSHQVVRS